MRIRKRFPSSSLSSLSLTDPQLNRSPVVQQLTQGSVQAYPDGNLCVQQSNINSQPSDPPNQPLPPASNQRLMIGSGWTRWASSDTIKAQEVKQQEMEGTEEVKQDRWGEEEKSNDIRKESIFGAEVGTQILPPSGNSSHQEVGRWYEGDKVVPLKKRRGSFERRVSEEIIPEKEKKMKAKMKSKTNKKCVQSQNGTGSDDEQEDYKEAINNSSAKKSKRGSVIMEGSRCSRVNGRGWRCCQQTLVGYSLCEHHLGKGRLRSINGTTSARSRATPKVPKKVESQHSISSMEYINDDDEDDDDDDDDDDDYYDDDDEQKPLMMTKKKKMKLGVVKARSMSSLLGQTNNVVVVADNNKNSRL